MATAAFETTSPDAHRRETPTINGQTEGQINRLKLIKWQMYGKRSVTAALCG
ncbi:hypothetical protein [Methylobacterium komagatae]